MPHMVFTIHLREIAAKTLIVLAASRRRFMVNIICCIQVHSKLPPDDEDLIYSKHVDDTLLK
jgi:hypothetical protein